MKFLLAKWNVLNRIDISIVTHFMVKKRIMYGICTELCTEYVRNYVRNIMGYTLT